MNITVFSTKSYDKRSMEEANRRHNHNLRFVESRLKPISAQLADGSEAVCAFVNDDLSAETLERLAGYGVRVIAMRCAGYNNVDLPTAKKLGLKVVRVPAYSPHAVAEHTLAMILTLNRKTHRAFNRIREGNFELDGLLGFDLHGRTAGVVGTGRIGYELVKILLGFGMKVLTFDPYPNKALSGLGSKYVPLTDLLSSSDIIVLTCPLTPQTRHMVNDDSLATMKDGVMLINTGRGALIDSAAAVAALKTGKIGYLGLDVYEEESDLFYENHSGEVIQDDIFARLLTFPNVLITGHQAFFTQEALGNIAQTTLENLTNLERGAGTVHLIAD